jgi:hypothetical protein
MKGRIMSQLIPVTWNGLKLTMFDRYRTAFDEHWRVSGFDNIEQAKAYADKILGSWGYFPSATIEQSEQAIIVSCSMALSCD